MASIDAYIYIIIGLLGVAYPVLLQVVARLDEKYSSENIVGLFNQELESKAFPFSLYSSLIFIVIWSLKLPPPTLTQISFLDFLIINSAALLLAGNSIILVIIFALFVRKILIYYTQSKFIPYLIKKHEKTDPYLKYFSALSDLLLQSIRRKETNFSRTLSDFFYTAFRRIRDNFSNKPVVYPAIYYEVVHKAVEELAILKEKRNYLLERRTTGEIWLLGELQGKEISEETYLCMWRNLLIAIQYQQDDLIINHWETCHQYYTFNLPEIYKEYDSSVGNFQVSNQETVTQRSAERQRFIEFHYALGGLLLYKERYVCIKRLFSHTQSQPPKYELLPESMNEIFKFYFAVKDPYELRYTWISSRYPFPELSGLNADYVIKQWLCSYLAILFLRQYTIFPYLITMRPLDFPQTPGTQGEIKEWIDGLDFFKNLVSDHLKNEKLLKILGLDFITQEWCEKDSKPYPISFIENFKKDLETAYHLNALNLQISDKKVSQFECSTKKIIESTFVNLKTFNNETQIPYNNADKWYVNGQKMLQRKDAFSENPEVDHMGFDSFLATAVSESLYEGFGETFFFKKTKSFLLTSEELFEAIDRLMIDEKFVIINFGINLDYFIKHLKTPALSNEKYKKTTIHSLTGGHLVKDSIFILKMSDLPNISTIPISDDLISKYSLNKISDKIELFTSIIDLNNTLEEIYNENKQNQSDDELRKSVLMNIIILTEFKWKKNIDLIQLQKYSEYSQKGIVNNLNDIKPVGMEKGIDEKDHAV